MVFSNYNVQLNIKAFQMLWNLDKKLIGSEEYMGFAYFWDHEFKKAVHDTALKDGLDFSNGYVKTNKKLQGIINKMLKKYPQRIR